MARLVKRYNDGGGEILDTAAMAENLKNDSLFFKDGKYTNYGKKHLEALNQIEKNQSSGIRYKIDSDAGTFRIVNPEGSRIDEDIEGGGLKIGESGLFKRDKKLVSKVLKDAVYKAERSKLEVDSLPFKELKELGDLENLKVLADPIKKPDVKFIETKPVVDEVKETSVKTESKPTTKLTTKPVPVPAKVNANNNEALLESTQNKSANPNDYLYSLLDKDFDIGDLSEGEYKELTSNLYSDKGDKFLKRKAISLMYLNKYAKGQESDFLYKSLKNKIKNAKSMSDLKNINFTPIGGVIPKISKTSAISYKGGNFVDEILGTTQHSGQVYKNGGRLVPKAQDGLSGLPTPKFKTTATFGGYNPYPWRSYPNKLDYMQNSLDLNSNPNTNITTNTNTTSDYAPWNEEVYDFSSRDVNSLPIKSVGELNPRSYNLAEASNYSAPITGNDRQIRGSGFSDRFRQAAQKIGNYDNNIGSFLGSNIGTLTNAALAYKAYKTPVGDYSYEPIIAERQAVPNVLAARTLNTNEQKRQISKVRTDFNTSDPVLNGILKLGAASRTNQALGGIASAENQFRLQEQDRVAAGENARSQALMENNNLTTRTINANNQLKTQSAMQRLQAEQARTSQFYQNLGAIGNELQGRVNSSNALDKQYAMAAYAQDGQQKYASAKLNYDDALLKLRLAVSRKDSPEKIKIYEQALENAKNNMPEQKTLQEIMSEMKSFKKGNFPWES